jgi:predicted nicotinamide N-methyase
VLRRYRLRRLRLPLGSGSLAVVVPDPGDWIRRGEWAAAAARGDEPPYWVQVWPASVAVARLLARHSELRGRRVLDLGCGLGIPGLAAAVRGATVTFADRERDALAFAAWNGSRLAPGRVEVTGLDWGREVLSGSFDVLVMADVSYRPVHHHALHRHVAACLASGGVIVHADPLRREATPFVRALCQDLPHLLATVATSFGGQRTLVRLCLAARDAGALAPWRRTMPAAIVDEGVAAPARA